MTELIARIAGLYLLATGLGFFVSRSFYERMVMGNAKSDPVLLNLSGAAHFIVGMVILMNHFQWFNAAQLTVTLLGLGATAKGAALIIIPETTLKSPKTVGTTLTATTIGFAVAGAWFIYVGFFSAPAV
jgi:hypothetical protein